MNGNPKELILCDFCNSGKDHMYTNRKQFAGHKLNDMLQTVTQRKIPLTAHITVCGLCASNIYTATATVTKALEVISKALSGSKKKIDATKEVPHVELSSDAEDEGGSPVPTKQLKSQSAAETKGTLKQGEQSLTKQKSIKELSGTPIGKELNAKKEAAKIKLPLTSTPNPGLSTPSKQKIFSNGGLEESLQNAVKITPAKDVPKKTKDFNQLFGASVENMSDTEDEEDEDDVVETVIEKPGTKNIAIGFECKLCDYTSTYPNPMKKHIRQLHGQKRPRIYNCLRCPKAFGVLKSLKTHMLTHGITEKKDDIPAPDPQLAVLTALKPKRPENVLNNNNNEYTFAIKNSNSSTPKPAGELSANSCEICKVEFKTAKLHKDHLKAVHNIVRPKAFKCDACPSTYMHKISMDRHYKKKHCGEGEAPVQIKLRRKTIAIDPTDNQIESSTPAKLPAKITARRNTVAAQDTLMEESNNILSPSALEDLVRLPSSMEDLIESVLENPSGIIASPTKSKSKVDSKLTESLALDKPKDSPKKQKSPTKVVKDNKDKELPLPKPNKSKENAAIVEEMPAKQKNKSIVETNADTPTKQMKNSLGDATEGASSKKSKVKTEADELDSSQIANITNGTPKKLGKRKAAKEPEEVKDTSQTEQQKASKKAKLGNSVTKASDEDVIEVIDEVNPNVKPHKRTKLDSIGHSESELNCSICHKVVASRKRLDSHIQKKHTIHLKCPRCNETYTKRMDYVDHFKTCNVDNGLPCGIKNCEKVFEAANFLGSHLAKKHQLN